MLSGLAHTESTSARLLRDVGIVASSGGIGVLLATAANVVAPTFMTQSDYGVWRIFLLYSGFVGVLHFGLADGVLVSWAGSSLAQHSGEFGSALLFLLIQQASLVALALVVGGVVPGIGDHFGYWLPLLIYVIPANLLSFFQFSLQAFRAFTYLAGSTILGQAGLVIAILALGTTNNLTASAAITATVLATAAAAMLACGPLLKSASLRKATPASAWRTGITMMRYGFGFLVGNVALTLFYGLDRLVVSSWYPPDVFAAYALPVTFIGFVYLLVAAATMVTFPYLASMAQAVRYDIYPLARSLAVGLWGLALLLYFPISALVYRVLPAYADSLPLLRILLLSVAFGGVVRSLHFNYFRLTLKTMPYVVASGVSLAIYAGLLAVAIHLGSSLEWVAWATVVGNAVWFGINEWFLRASLGAVDGRTIARPLLGLLLFGSGFWLATSAAGVDVMAAAAYGVWATLVVVVLFGGELAKIGLVAAPRKRSSSL